MTARPLFGRIARTRGAEWRSPGRSPAPAAPADAPAATQPAEKDHGGLRADDAEAQGRSRRAGIEDGGDERRAGLGEDGRDRRRGERTGHPTAGDARPLSDDGEEK